MGTARLFKSYYFRIPAGGECHLSWEEFTQKCCPLRAEEVRRAQLCRKARVVLAGWSGPRALLLKLTNAFCLLQVHSFKGYWEKLNSNLEYIKYSKPPWLYNNSMVQREWHSLISEEVCADS